VIFSFEFFPPKTTEAEQRLLAVAGALQAVSPAFFTTTYGAGGSTQGATLKTVAALQKMGTPTAAHITCVGASRAETDALARSLWDTGITRLVALRGDAPAGSGPYQPHPQGYAYASDMIEGLLKIAPFDISAACYPEKHPEATSLEADIQALLAKQKTGAQRAISQFFFNPSVFLRFRDQAAKAGVTLPLVPGLLPVYSLAQVQKFAALCGAAVPAALQRFEGLDEADSLALAADILFWQCEALRREGCPQVHIYTLNRAEPTLQLCRALGVVQKIGEENP
jgi:methylenetetrahydrofolate reductase (NADPH)